MNISFRYKTRFRGHLHTNAQNRVVNAKLTYLTRKGVKEFIVHLGKDSLYMRRTSL